MKKLSKFLLSFCMMFVLAFSFVACANPDDDDDDDDDSPTITMTDYANNLYENHDYKSSYIASSIYYEVDAEPQTKITITKYTYSENTAHIAVYNEDEVMTNYYEIETVVAGGLYRFYEYNLTNKTYTVKSLGADDINAKKANLYLAEKIVMQMFQVELNQGLDIGSDISELLPEGVSLSDTMTNPSNGKYVLKRTMSGIDDNKTISTETKLTCVNGKVKQFSANSIVDNDIDISLDVSYEYKDVTINIDKTAYTDAQ